MAIWNAVQSSPESALRLFPLLVEDEVVPSGVVEISPDEFVNLKLCFRPRGSRILPCLKCGAVSVKGVEFSKICLSPTGVCCLSGDVDGNDTSEEEVCNVTTLGFLKLGINFFFKLGGEGEIVTSCMVGRLGCRGYERLLCLGDGPSGILISLFAG